jgi:predicted deacylase
MIPAIELQKRIIIGLRSGPHLLITGGVHGDEYEPMAALRLLGQCLSSESMMGRVTLVPVVNEAAFQRGDRTADDGLDLARTCPGRADGSITEQIAHGLSSLIRSADFYIDLHTGGLRLRVLPMTGYMLHPDPAVLEQQRQMARAFNLPIIWGTDPNLGGRSLSAARDAKVPAIYAEYLGGATLNRDGVEAYVEGCLNVMAHLGMIERVSPPSRITDVVEDTRTGSGHMQVCNLSPVDGFFESAVDLGDRIQKGDLLGRVVDPLGNYPMEIHSQQTGLVLVLRAIPSVKKGDSLAVILEMVPSALA